MGSHLPTPKGCRTPIIAPFLKWQNGWMHQDALGMQVDRGPVHVVLGGDPAPPGLSPPKKISARVYCGQTAGWIKIRVGTEVGLSPGDFVFDWDQLSQKKRHNHSPNFWPMPVVDKRLNGSRCYLVLEYRPRPRSYYVTWGPSFPPPLKRAQQPQFSAHVRCGQTYGGIKIPLGTEAALAALC